jgi:hypothetical protein
MARYLVTYDNGMEDTITATKVDKNFDSSEYRFLDTSDQPVAYVPASNVLSIVRQDDEEVTG